MNDEFKSYSLGYCLYSSAYFKMNQAGFKFHHEKKSMIISDILTLIEKRQGMEKKEYFQNYEIQIPVGKMQRCPQSKKIILETKKGTRLDELIQNLFE